MLVDEETAVSASARENPERVLGAQSVLPGPWGNPRPFDPLAQALVDAAGRFGRARAAQTMPSMLSTIPPVRRRESSSIESAVTELNLASLKLSDDVRLLARSELQRQWNRDGNNQVIVAMNRLMCQPDHFSPVPYERDQKSREWAPVYFSATSTLLNNVVSSARTLNSLYAKYVSQLAASTQGIAKERAEYVLLSADRDRYADATMLTVAYMARDFGFPPVDVDDAVPVLKRAVQRQWSLSDSRDLNARSLYAYAKAGVLMLAAEELRKVTRSVWREAGKGVPALLSAAIEELHEDGVAARDCDIFGPFDRIAVSFQYDCGGRLPIPKHTSQTPRWRIYA